MLNFIKNLINAENPMSSKRFAALSTLFCTIIMAFMAAIKNNWVVPMPMFNGLLLVVAGLFGFNMAENILQNFKKQDDNVAEKPQEGKSQEENPQDETPQDNS